jgi:pterin-4a-carbinolamine dehydratase
MEERTMNQKTWQERNRPARLERRYEFDDYESLRAFLDEAADLSEKEGLYPDIGFGRTHASFTIHAEDGSEGVNDQQRKFAAILDSLETANQAQ